MRSTTKCALAVEGGYSVPHVSCRQTLLDRTIADPAIQLVRTSTLAGGGCASSPGLPLHGRRIPRSSDLVPSAHQAHLFVEGRRQHDAATREGTPGCGIVRMAVRLSLICEIQMISNTGGLVRSPTNRRPRC